MADVLTDAVSDWTWKTGLLAERYRRHCIEHCDVTLRRRSTHAVSASCQSNVAATERLYLLAGAGQYRLVQARTYRDPDNRVTLTFASTTTLITDPVVTRDVIAELLLL